MTDLLARAERLLAIPRALTGDGVREALAALGEVVPGLTVHEVASGTPVLDWVVPQEWNLRRATLTAPDGTVVADTDAHLLHVVGYSEPVSTTTTLAALEAEGRLHSLPDQPDLIPWRTSYYRRTWGFCLPHRVRQALPVEGTYRVAIDATLADGHLTYGEAVLAGETDAEILLSAHLCHPAMANDNVSGIVVAAEVMARLAQRPKRRHTVRLLLAPGTIGAITWLARSAAATDRIVAGLVVSGVADPGPAWTYKSSLAGDAPMDRAMAVALRDVGGPHQVVAYEPWGYDERQFNSLGYRLGVGLLNRTPHGTYPEYHTSADDLSFISEERLEAAVDLVLAAIDGLEHDRTYRNLKPHGEPQLGPRGLYPSVGGQRGQRAQLAMFWVLALSDGQTGLLAVAERSGLALAELVEAADKLAATDLLELVR